MMLESFSTNAITTKTMAMYGKRLVAENYQELVRMKSVAEVAGYLKNQTAYGGAFASVQESQIHRGQLEQLIYKELFSRYARLIRYDFSKRGGLYAQVIVSCEIREILNSIRLLNSASSDKFILSLPGYLIDHAGFDMLALAKATSFEQIARVLEHTDYAKIVEPFAPRTPDEKVNIVACERALYTYYFDWIFRQIDKDFSGDSRKQLRDLFCMQVDLMNLSALYRMKRYFNMNQAEIRACLLSFPTALSKAKLEQMIAAPNHRELLALIEKTRYGRDIPGEEIDFVEDVAARARFLAGKKHIRFSAQAPVVLISYMMLMEIEVANLVNIIEGIRYGLDPQEIEKLLVFE